MNRLLALLLAFAALAAAVDRVSGSAAIVRTPTPIFLHSYRNGAPLAVPARVIADDFAWAENLSFGSEGRLFISGGDRVSQITFHAKGMGYINSPFIVSEPVSPFQFGLGLAVDQHSTPNRLFGNARLTNGSYVIYECPIAPLKGEPLRSHVCAYPKVVVILPGMGNGLGLWYTESGAIRLYAAFGDDYEVGAGGVWEIDPAHHTFREFKTGLWGANGLWIDRASATMYVGQLTDAAVWTYDLRTGTDRSVLRSVRAPVTRTMLDDLTLMTDEHRITTRTEERVVVRDQLLGTNWWWGELEVFSSSDAAVPVRTIIAGLHCPTSVRWGNGSPGFKRTSLFVTEGGLPACEPANDGSGSTGFRLIEIPDASVYVDHSSIPPTSVRQFGAVVLSSTLVVLLSNLLITTVVAAAIGLACVMNCVLCCKRRYRAGSQYPYPPPAARISIEQRSKSA